ncbi:MAG: nicotinate phosphoribosyltransferase [Actinomycetota bacterium]
MRPEVPGGPGSGLLTDLYELTMAASYHAEGMDYTATFELFSRILPGSWNFLIACGIRTALEYLETVGFTADDLEYLKSLGDFDDDFLAYLAGFRFSGEVWAMPEGEGLFPPEPVLRVRAPLIEAQIVETYLLNVVDFETLVASKAARVAIACRGRPFVDFSARRDHGPDAAMLAARASFVGGAAATSNVLAAKRFRIPPSGTMAHSYVMTTSDEKEAFRRFARRFPDRSIFLIDTYDTIAGARKAVEVADELVPEGIRVQAVRIDSGELNEVVPRVRRILDEAGHPEIQIFVSGDLNERVIDRLLESGSAVDGFGVGTAMGTGGDVSSLGGAYKLVDDEGGPRLKLSVGKATLPGAKQVHRFRDNGRYSRDLIGLADEPAPEGGRPLLEKVMEGGKMIAEESLDQARDRCRSTLASLPDGLTSLEQVDPYPVGISKGLQQLNDRLTSSAR